MADVSVRPARTSDVPAVAELQVELLRSVYAPLLPARALDDVADADAEARWRAAVEAPPSPRHRVLVAVEAGRLVGFAALGPAEDEDLDPAVAGELLTLLVEPGSGRRGHGSRLLAAAVEHLRGDGVRYAVSWPLSADEVTLGFLRGAGWAEDGASRELEAGGTVRQVRLATDLSEPADGGSAADEGRGERT